MANLCYERGVVPANRELICCAAFLGVLRRFANFQNGYEYQRHRSPRIAHCRHETRHPIQVRFSLSGTAHLESASACVDHQTRTSMIGGANVDFGNHRSM